MVDISQFRDKTLRAIEAKRKIVEPRPYLGMSSLGHSCPRYLWYSFRWCFSDILEPRMKRLFNRGHREEPEIIKVLMEIGIRCWGDQDEVVMAHGHCKGHRDGVCLGVLEAPKTEHLLEMKTMSDKYFKKITKEGVKVSKPIYHAQCQIYMRKFGLTRTLFIAVNKNTDAWYIERLKLDKGFADDLERKAESIILAEAPPEKPFKPTWYECKFCSANLICHYEKQVEKNCRTCNHCDLLPEGKWQCSHHGIELSTSQQRMPCSKYSLLTPLRKNV